MKLDAEVVNLELLELFSQREDSENLAAMIKKAKRELGTQTLSSRRFIRGLEIPFSVPQALDSQG